MLLARCRTQKPRVTLRRHKRYGYRFVGDLAQILVFAIFHRGSFQESSCQRVTDNIIGSLWLVGSLFFWGLLLMYVIS